MRIVRPSKVANVDDARLLTDLDRLTALIDPTRDVGRGELIRNGARRVIVIDELRRRGFDIPMSGNPDGCRQLFGID